MQGRRVKLCTLHISSFSGSGWRVSARGHGQTFFSLRAAVAACRTSSSCRNSSSSSAMRAERSWYSCAHPLQQQGFRPPYRILISQSTCTQPRHIRRHNTPPIALVCALPDLFCAAPDRRLRDRWDTLHTHGAPAFIGR